MKIAVGVNADEKTLAAWRAASPGVEFVATTNTEDRKAAIADADAYIGRMPREVFVAHGARLRWVHSDGAGIEGLAAIPELAESDVIVTNTRGSHATTISEHTIGMLLVMTRRFADTSEDQKAHVWKRPGLAASQRELAGSTMVIVGVGNLGRAIAKRAAAFEIRVLGVDLFPGAVPEGMEAVWPLDRLDDALAQADVVVIALPETPQTRGLFDAGRIGKMKPGGYLLLISRGGIVDEAALIAALEAGHLAGAGLDVTVQEPLPEDSPLWDAPHLVLTPHCSGHSRQTTQRVWDTATENIRRFVRGEELMNVCDKRAGF